ncbi:MAG TPA: DUF5818 domain-containing protein [Candidatus Acidoferrales bacterium]|jgi:hypothetical protein|nr:DUF5818 domain-containing protein [Candidatus Acidoferrales bacterium]
MKRADLLLGCVVFLYGVLPAFNGTANAAPRAMASRAVEAYSGTIVSLNGERYVLRDNDSDSWYNLDDQRDASKYAGKKVLVVGRLDTHTDVIHVEQIEEAK